VKDGNSRLHVDLQLVVEREAAIESVPASMGTPAVYSSRMSPSIFFHEAL